MVTNAAWGGIGIALTALAVLWTWFAFRNRGTAPGVRGIALVLLALGIWLTGTIRLFARIADAVAEWAVRLVFSPSVWIGTGLLVLGVVVFLVSLRMSADAPAKAGARGSDREVRGRSRTGDGGVADTLGEDADDITAILRKHGIS